MEKRRSFPPPRNFQKSRIGVVLFYFPSNSKLIFVKRFLYNLRLFTAQASTLDVSFLFGTIQALGSHQTRDVNGSEICEPNRKPNRNRTDEKTEIQSEEKIVVK